MATSAASHTWGDISAIWLNCRSMERQVPERTTSLRGPLVQAENKIAACTQVAVLR